MTNRLSKETSIAAASLLGIAVYLTARFGFHLRERDSRWILIAVLIAGVPLLFDLVKKLAAFEVGSDALAGISIITSAILGEYLAGAIIVLMLSGGKPCAMARLATGHRKLPAPWPITKRTPRLRASLI